MQDSVVPVISADGLKWAQRHSPVSTVNYLGWAQRCSYNMLPMVSNGPSVVPQ
jgi:hypothetical protein